MIDILLVEDHRELAQLIVSFLKRDGFQVHHVESGEAALSYLAQTEVRLLLLDIMLPHMDGFTVCKKVREHKAVPILIMSARKYVLFYSVHPICIARKPYPAAVWSLSVHSTEPLWMEILWS